MADDEGSALGDFAGAIADFDRALALNPDFCVAYISRGNARFHKRDAAGASADYLRAFRIDPALAVNEVVRILIQNHRQDSAGVLDNARKHIRINPKDFVAESGFYEGASAKLPEMLLFRDIASSDYDPSMKLGERGAAHG